MPFVVIMLLFMALMSIFPEIALWLPNGPMGPDRSARSGPRRHCKPGPDMEQRSRRQASRIGIRLA